MHIRWDLAGSALVYVIVLLIGSHLFLRWLYAEITSRGGGGRRVWKAQWTVSGFVMVVVMFVAGIAGIGIAHQTTWLARSPEPLYRRSSYRANRVKCAGNLRQIGLGLVEYADAHEGTFPDDFAELFPHADITADIFVCPATWAARRGQDAR
jgi:hypothetical protein